MEQNQKVKYPAYQKPVQAILFPVEIRVNKTGKITETRFLQSETTIKNELDALKSILQMIFLQPTLII